MIADRPDESTDLQRLADEMAQRWHERLNNQEGVGRRHHVVPAFHLRRFANSRGQVRVRDKATNTASLRSINDLAMLDFYTFINDRGERDGSLEQLLQIIEGRAAQAIGRLLDPFRWPGPLSLDDSHALAQFLGFQLVRGPRARRETEIVTNHVAKTVMGYGIRDKSGRRAARRKFRFNDKIIAGVTVVPHPNEHIKVMLGAAERVTSFIVGRPSCLVTLDQPLLLTGDEPVVLDVDADNGAHRPECHQPGSQGEGKRRRREVIHLQGRRGSVANASAIIMALTPRCALVFGQHGETPPPVVGLAKRDAIGFAADLNAEVIRNSLLWVIGHPDHPALATMDMPSAEPILQFCDPHQALRDDSNQPPSPRNPRLLRHIGRPN